LQKVGWIRGEGALAFSCWREYRYTSKSSHIYELSALNGMIIEHPFLCWLRKAGLFLVCCFGTAVLMRLFMLEYDSVFTLPFGLLALVGSSALGWFILRRWRFVAPLRCASELGVCAGIGGLGLYILFAYGIVYLFTPHF
jgi:hypothetical protein